MTGDALFNFFRNLLPRVRDRYIDPAEAGQDMETGDRVYYSPDVGMTGNEGTLLATRGDSMQIEIDLRVHIECEVCNTAVYYGKRGDTMVLTVPYAHVYPA